ncbi:hypothetical protein DPM19_25190 [Actinomadura craniellae]|uniref:Diaminopimelate epimerase n=1 Tax=Actinomadura craniellae TaxID=2231787 RepID=A0A365H024_9ACTN|nr:hypothetical protein [Actinomadura craniellae]RAY12444.1 hypothetical protein DPM19_25190 [Actinomadura craniellae]
MRLEYAVLAPSGNVTLLIFTRVARDRQPVLAERLMAARRDIEQVGFVEPPTTPAADARLQMMGGEFCGNAAGALAWYLARGGRPNRQVLEVSGASVPIRADTNGDLVELDVPVAVRAPRRAGNATVVMLDGITHLLVGDAPPRAVRAEAHRWLRRSGLLSLPAAGVVFHRPRGAEIEISPVVHVRATGTLTAESSCASGSACVAILQALRRGCDTVVAVRQPDGGVIEAGARVSPDGRGVIAATVSVRVRMCEEGVFAPAGARGIRGGAHPGRRRSRWRISP